VIVGIPAETKDNERRVAITPAGAREVVAAGHDVVIQQGAGMGSGITDDRYRAAGAQIAATVEEIYDRGELILHVKEPQPTDLALLRPSHTLFTYLHLAAYPDVGAALAATGCTAIAYETVELPDGSLPLLAPMSRVAGRMAVQAGAHLLEAAQGGKGVLMGGIPGVARARVTVLGAGSVGWNAIDVAVGMGARVAVLDVNLAKLEAVEAFWGGRVETLHSNVSVVEEEVTRADLLVGAVLVAGDRAPVVVSEDLIKAMAPGSVVVDVAIDQGGCIATSRETTHAEPTYRLHDVVHYCVGNMPGAVPHTSTYALTNATMRYVVALTGPLDRALARYPELTDGVNLVAGRYTNAAVAHALGQPVASLVDLLA
jgi:alanine dehydrogenase